MIQNTKGKPTQKSVRISPAKTQKHTLINFFRKFLKNWIKVTFHGFSSPPLLDMGPSQDHRSSKSSKQVQIPTLGSLENLSHLSFGNYRFTSKPAL